LPHKALIVGARRAVPDNKMNDKLIKRRNTLRLENFDYSSNGAYFVTVGVKNHECLLGEIKNREMILNDAGKIVQTVWDEIPAHYQNIDTDAFCIMPNHIHGIILIVGVSPRAYPADNCNAAILGQPQGVAPTLSLPDVVHRFKTMTTKLYSDGVKNSGWLTFPGKFWQRSYYDHIIRNEKELNKIKYYIQSNPQNWDTDEENPINLIVGARRAVPKKNEK